jgi:hypothetical protein
MKKFTHNTFSAPVDKETIALNPKGLRAVVNVMTGIENDTWVFFCPSLNVSGYGPTKDEAMASFDHNLEVLMHDLFNSKLEDRVKYIKCLGWKQDKFFNKQYSKAYIDKDGQLKNLETPELLSLEAVI